MEIRAKPAVINDIEITYREFVLLIMNDICSIAQQMNAEQIDLVADFYHSLSIKGAIRSERGSGTQVKFDIDDLVPDEFLSALTNSNFKADLKNYLQDQISSRNGHGRKISVFPKEETWSRELTI